MVKNTETPNDDTTKKGGSLLSALTGLVMRFADKRLIAENDRLAGLLAQKLAPRSNILISTCSVCKTHYGVKDARGAEGGWSHGFCEPCLTLRLVQVTGFGFLPFWLC